MNKKPLIYLFALLMLSCAHQDEPSTSDLTIQLAYNSEHTASRVDALAVSDKIGVFCALDGTENYTLRNALFTVGTDDKTLETSPAPYYPDPKRAVNFYAYLPYQVGQSDASGVAFSVPTDQTSAAALKSADLLWGRASSVPVAEAVPIVFNHLMARVIVKLASAQAVEQVTLVGAVRDGRLNVSTGAFTLGSTTSNVSSTKQEFIIPSQLLPRLIVKVSGVDYIFENTSSIVLTASATNTLSLTLNPITQTATLANPTAIVSPWLTASKTDEASQEVENNFTAHWLVADYRFDQINRINLTIKDNISSVTKDYKVSNVSLISGSTIAAASYTFNLKNFSDLHYPYTVSAIKLYKDATLVHTTAENQLVTKSGNVTLGWSQNISLTLSSPTASVGAQVTSAAFTLTSNVPYTSVYTAGGASAQGVGSQPPYSSLPVTFTFPAQGASAAAARNHTMTITPTVDYIGSPNKRAFTVTQAAVPPTLAISSAAPGVTIPAIGATYYTNITSNTTWSATATNATVTATGTGDVTSFAIQANPNYVNSTRSVSVILTTTSNVGHTEISRIWSGNQVAAVPPTGCFAIPLPNSYVYISNTDGSSDSYTDWQNGVDKCTNWGGRLPTLNELVSIYNNKLNYGTFVDFYYWTSTPSNGSYNIVNLTTGHISTHTYPTYYANVRCVKDA